MLDQRSPFSELSIQSLNWILFTFHSIFIFVYGHKVIQFTLYRDNNCKQIDLYKFQHEKVRLKLCRRGHFLTRNSIPLTRPRSSGSHEPTNLESLLKFSAGSLCDFFGDDLLFCTSNSTLWDIIFVTTQREGGRNRSSSGLDNFSIDYWSGWRYKYVQNAIIRAVVVVIFLLNKNVPWYFGNISCKALWIYSRK